MNHSDVYTEEQLAQAIGRLHKHPFAPFRFSAALENRFRGAGAHKRAVRRTQLGWMCIAFYVILLIGDFQLIHDRIAMAFAVRLLFVVPILIFANTLSSHTSLSVRETNIVVTAVLVSGSNLLLYGGISSSLTSAAQISVLTTLLLAIVIMRLRFRYALILTALLILMQLVTLSWDPTLTLAARIYTSTPMLCGELFILFAGYSLEREARITFLLRLRTVQQNRQLISLNNELARISAQDALSGLANRAAFNKRYNELWREARESNRPLSLILLDIDHFKQVNDMHGHLYGDEVIRRVSQLIMQSLRGKEDFAARYGGEEFIILLPGTSHALAVKVAQRMRRMIELAGAPAVPGSDSSPTRFTTVSGGVATYPGPQSSTQDTLLHAADTALYAAKGAGRNRIHSANVIMNEPTIHIARA